MLVKQSFYLIPYYLNLLDNNYLKFCNYIFLNSIIIWLEMKDKVPADAGFCVSIVREGRAVDIQAIRGDPLSDVRNLSVKYHGSSHRMEG